MPKRTKLKRETSPRVTVPVIASPSRKFLADVPSAWIRPARKDAR